MLRMLLAAALVVSTTTGAKGDEPRQQASLDGTWTPTTAEMAGQQFPDEVRKTIKLVVKGDRYTVTVGKSVDEGKVRSDATAKPKTLDITGEKGPNKGKTILAIYELDGDKLRVCYDLGGKARPKEFKTTEGSQLFLVTYERAK